MCELVREGNMFWRPCGDRAENRSQQKRLQLQQRRTLLFLRHLNTLSRSRVWIVISQGSVMGEAVNPKVGAKQP